VQISKKSNLLQHSAMADCYHIAYTKCS